MPRGDPVSFFRRREFSNPVKRAAFARSRGICECHRITGVPGLLPGGCNKPLGVGNLFYEHINPDGRGGAPSLDNCACLTKTCWRIKTDTFDRPVVAKANRQRDMAIAIRTSAGGQKIPGGRSDWWGRKLSGATVIRRSGIPL